MFLKLLLNTQMIWMIYIYIYKNIEEYNPNKKRKMSIMIADMLSNKKLKPIVSGSKSEAES